MWKCECQITHQRPDGWTLSGQVPTFFLDENIQGILDKEGAEHIAKKIVNPLNLEGVFVHAYCVKVKLEES